MIKVEEGSGREKSASMDGTIAAAVSDCVSIRGLCSKAREWDSRIVVQPFIWFKEEPSQFSMGQTAQSLTCSIMEKPHTGLGECPRILLSCFRARNSGFHSIRRRRDQDNVIMLSPLLCIMRPAAPSIQNVQFRRLHRPKPRSRHYFVFMTPFIISSDSFKGLPYMTSAKCSDFFTPPPCHVQKSTDCVPFVCFFGTPSPNSLRTSFMEAPSYLWPKSFSFSS